MASGASPFIGIGPGRCGTASLARIIGACKNVSVSHEGFPSPWYAPGPNIGKLILAMKSGEHTGDVSCILLPHVQQIRDPVRNLKVICLHRHKAEVVKSFCSCAPPSNLRPSDRALRERDYPEVVARFPVIDAATPEQAWGFYWEMSEELMRKVKEPVLHIQMRSLNDDFTVRNIFEFLDIPPEDVVMIDRRIWNSSEEHLRV